MKRILNIFKWIFGNRVRAVIFIILLLAIGFFGFKSFSQKNTQPTYQTATAEKGSLVTSVTASGTVLQGSSVPITTQATGLVSQVYVKDGDTVTTGQKIAELTLDVASEQKQTAALASYQQATNTVASSRNTLNTLQSNLFTTNQDFINDAVARDLTVDDPTYIEQHADWLAAEGAYKNQQGVITGAQTSASSAWLTYLQLSPTITAPTSGMISGLTLTIGLPINASSATTSTSLGTIMIEKGTPLASVNLTEIDVVKAKVGQKVTLKLDSLPDKTFAGIVSAINTNGIVSSGVTTYPATITFDISFQSIYPNMAISATIITDIKHNVILVPSGAVQTAGGRTSLRVLSEDGQVNSVPAKVGNSNDTQTEIISGIEVGDIVVTGQTNTTNTGTGTTTSPFGNTRGGFGGAGGAGGAGGGQRR